MSVEMPPALAWVAKLAVGQSWPKGDEDRLRKLGSAWDDAAQELRGISEGMGSSANGVLESVGGQVAEEFRAFVTQLEAALPEMAESSKQLGKLGRHTGVQIEYSKYMILGQLVLLAGQIAHWAFFAPEVLPAAITSARAAVKMILRRLLISVAAGVALNLGLDAAVQTIQILKGDRTRWSVDNTVSAAISGAIGGAVGGVFFGIGGVVVPRFANSLIGKGVFGAATGVTTAGIMLGAFGGEELLGASVAAGAVGALGGGGRRRFGGKGEKVEVDPVHVDLPDEPVLDLPDGGRSGRTDAPVPVAGGSGPGGAGGAGGRGASGPAATVTGDRPRTSGGPGRDHAGAPPDGTSGRTAAVLPGFGPATADTGRAGGHGAAGTTTRGAGTGGSAAGRQGTAGAATSAGSGRVQGGTGGTGGAAGRASAPQAGGGRAAEGASSGGHAGPAVRTVAGPASGTATAGGPGTGAPAGGAASAGRTPTGGPEIRVEGSRGVASGPSAAEAASAQTGRPAPAGGRPVTSGGPSAPGATAGGPARPAAGP
ncbi:WXG100 family type VII secretion target, partial [Kitasatospora sp. NPDC127111]|uniref:WXG100 family type VII secretion target n=1 Tax=Kitasatospora sp. NPDC127111 TaxID=3345363 RepID=UPI003637FF3D